MENGLLYVLAFSAMAIALFAAVLPQAQLYSEISGIPTLPYGADVLYETYGSDYRLIWKNGTTSTTADFDQSLNTTIAYLHNIGGGLIYVSNGNFYVDTPICLRGEVQVKGAGMGATVLYLKANSNCSMFVWNGVTPTEYFFELTDMQLYGYSNGGNNTATNANAVYIKSAASNQSSDVHLNRVFISYWGGAGVNISYCWGLQITNCIIEYNRYHGAYLVGDSAVILNNRLLINYYSGLYLSGGHQVVQGNYIEGNDQYGIVVTGGSYSGIISGNAFYDNSKETSHTTWYGAIWLANQDHTSIAGNSFDGASHEAQAILVSSNCDNATIVGNTFRGYSTEVADSGTGTIIEHNGGI